MTTPDLTDVEMREILKAIARDGRNGAARIAAIKEFRAMAEEAALPSTFAKLYEIQSPENRRKARR